jgi:hypothetical protein
MKALAAMIHENLSVKQTLDVFNAAVADETAAAKKK